MKISSIIGTCIAELTACQARMKGLELANSEAAVPFIMALVPTVERLESVIKRLNEETLELGAVMGAVACLTEGDDVQAGVKGALAALATIKFKE